MTRLKQQYEADCFFGIGILNSESEENIGTLWRSAHILGAAFIFTIDKRYKKQSTDVTRSWTKIPLYHYENFEEFIRALPYDTQLVGVEMGEASVAIDEFEHPPRGVYLLGCESIGLPMKAIKACHSLISLPGNFSLNVATAGSIVIYDRISKIKTRLPVRG
jgi:tRNA G18 (ribose-2'-O)-methylase SpoU